LQISAELIPLVEDLDAQKVLAVQVVEEAKHVTALQRYLELLGGEIPPVNFFCKQVLEGVRATKSPAVKLLGMQLLVENLAHHLFLEIRSHVEEPVLRDLLRYIDQDEAKHVGLARNYLPRILARAGKLETAKILGYSTFWGLCLLSAGYQLKEAAESLDIDVAKGFRRVTREHRKLVSNLGWFWRLCTKVTLSDPFIEWLADTLYTRRNEPIRESRAPATSAKGDRA
ncbi:MAG: ferritin-like domain-containing protein, partial [Deltaproteobacteria bacterium]